MNSDILSARDFAVEWHGDRPYGEEKYVVHLDRVAAILRKLGAPEWHIIAAYLHDVLEDTYCPIELIEQRFGYDVRRWVFAVTGEGKNRKERRQSILAKLAIEPDAALLKLCDRLANVEYSVEKGDVKKLAMYRKELPLYDALFEAVSPELNAKLRRLLTNP